MTTQGIPLRDLVHALGWTYGTVWSMPNRRTEIVSADGAFDGNPLKRYDSEYFDVESLFVSSYKTCAFRLGCGYIGKVLKEGQPLWLNDTDVLMRHSNTPSQARFFKVADIQTLLCIPWFNSVIELGTASLLPQNANLLSQIQSFLSHMATLNSKQKLANAYFPMEDPHVSQDLSAGSDDASFSGVLSHDQQVESGLSPGKISRATQHRPAPAEYDLGHGEVVAGSGESDWRLGIPSDEILPQKNLTSSQPPSSTLRRQRLQELEVNEVDNFGSSFLISPLQQMPLLSQLEHNHSISTSHSSSRADDTNNLLSASNGNSEPQSDIDQYSPQNRNCSNVSRKSTGFTPWNANTVRGAQKRDSHSNQVVLQRCINMTHRMSQMNASRERLGAAEQTHFDVIRQSTALDAEEVLSGHDEAAVNHMLAERRRRQKQKENFSALRSLIPFVSKMDRASILGDAISYVKQLTARVEELESLNRELEAQLPGLQRKRSRTSTITSV